MIIKDYAQTLKYYIHFRRLERFLFAHTKALKNSVQDSLVDPLPGNLSERSKSGARFEGHDHRRDRAVSLVRIQYRLDGHGSCFQEEDRPVAQASFLS